VELVLLISLFGTAFRMLMAGWEIKGFHLNFMHFSRQIVQTSRINKS